MSGLFFCSLDEKLLNLEGFQFNLIVTMPASSIFEDLAGKKVCGNFKISSVITSQQEMETLTIDEKRRAPNISN